MSPELIAELSKETKSPLHEALLRFCMERLRPAKDRMRKYYGQWDYAETVYNSCRDLSKDEVAGMKMGLPGPLSVPLTFAQVNTFVAFGYTLLNQREKFFELKGTGDEDRPYSMCAEDLLQSDIEANEGKAKVYQALLDVGRYGMCVQKEHWEVQTAHVPVVQMTEAQVVNGIETVAPEAVENFMPVTLREGNKIQSVSPYRFFPDSKVPLTNWKDGEFVGFEMEFGRTKLKEMEGQGLVAGVQWIPKLSLGKDSLFDYNDRFGIISAGPTAPEQKPTGPVCISELIAWCVPKQLKGDSGPSLGALEVPVRYVFWVANGTRVIRAEPLNSWHCQWPCGVSFFSPDSNSAREIMQSLCRVTGDLTGLISWFLNSRIAAVSRTVDNQLIVDPSGIDMSSIESRSRIILAKKNAFGRDIQRYVSQLQVQDTTTGHVADANNLLGLLQLCTGINENALGQYNDGRRSATEARAVTNSAASRMRIVVELMWESLWAGQGRRLLSNYRQSVSMEQFVAVCGESNAQYFGGFRKDPMTLARSRDQVVFDGTLPSDKLFMAQSLMELMGLIMSNPVAGPLFNINPDKVLKETYKLRGIGGLGNFAYDDELSRLSALGLANGGPDAGQGAAGGASGESGAGGV